MLFDRIDDVAQDGWALGTSNHKEVWKPVNRKSEKCARSSFPCAHQGEATYAFYVQPQYRTGQCVITSGKHEYVGLDFMAALQSNPMRCNSLNRIGSDVLEVYIGTVVHLVVVRLGDHSLGSAGVCRKELCCRCRILHGESDHCPHELGYLVVRLQVRHRVLVGKKEPCSTALPELFKSSLPALRWIVERHDGVHAVPRNRRVTVCGITCRIEVRNSLDLAFQVFASKCVVPSWSCVVRGSLKHRQAS